MVVICEQDAPTSLATMSELCESPDPTAALRNADGESLGPLDAILADTPPDRRAAGKPWLLAPVDLQAIKAAGVTFVVSMLERVIEERARGNRRRPQRSGLRSPGSSATILFVSCRSPAATALKRTLSLGTMFAPTEDRDELGKGFTPKIGDIVEVTAPRLGALINRMQASPDCEAWSLAHEP